MNNTENNLKTEDADTSDNKKDIFRSFPNHDRFNFPENMVRVTAGNGGEAILVFGNDKTALFDCGMAYCGEQTVKNIEDALKRYKRESLDYIIISHTHYDHIGALPYVKKRWSQAKVYGAVKAQQVLLRPGAIKVIKEMGTAARDTYSDSGEDILTDGFGVDITVNEGDKIFIGENQYFNVLETKGHTDCSLTYILEPEKIMFASESTGVLENPKFVHTAILKSYSDSMEAAEKCRAYGAKLVICPHFGVLPQYFINEFFDLFIKSADDKKNFLYELYKKGLGFEDALKIYTEHYWVDARVSEQPKEAFLENAKNIVKVIFKEFEKTTGI